MFIQKLFIVTIFTLITILFKETLTHPLQDAKMERDGDIPLLELPKSQAWMHRKRVTQREAMVFCEKRDPPGRLIVLQSLDKAKELVKEIYEISFISTSAEKTFSEERKTEIGLSRRYWIGLSDMQHEGEWLWLKDGTPILYEDMWTGGQPDHYSDRGIDKHEHCVLLWNPNFDNRTEIKQPKHTFNDENCQHKHYFICENIPSDGNKPVPNAPRPVRKVSAIDGMETLVDPHKFEDKNEVIGKSNIPFQGRKGGEHGDAVAAVETMSQMENEILSRRYKAVPVPVKDESVPRNTRLKPTHKEIRQNDSNLAGKSNVIKKRNSADTKNIHINTTTTESGTSNVATHVVTTTSPPMTTKSIKLPSVNGKKRLVSQIKNV